MQITTPRAARADLGPAWESDQIITYFIMHEITWHNEHLINIYDVEYFVSATFYLSICSLEVWLRHYCAHQAAGLPRVYIILGANQTKLVLHVGLFCPIFIGTKGQPCRVLLTNQSSRACLPNNVVVHLACLCIYYC